MTIDPDPYLSLSTKEGWASFVSDDPPLPPKITIAEREAQAPHERAAYDLARRRYMTSSGIVMTDDFKTVLKAFESRLRINEFKPSGKLGLILSGEPGLGKTTTVTQIGKLHARRREQQAHPAGWPGNLSVVYVTVPPSCTHKSMIAEIAHFLGLPVGARTSQPALMNSVAEIMKRLRVELVIVDEIHNLNLNNHSNADASDALKQLSEKVAATFIYAGVNIESSGLLDGPRGQQIASRFELHRASAFSNRSNGKREEWNSVLVAMEKALCLIRQEEDAILAHADALFDLSGGSIGRLADILHLSAIGAIDDGSERISPRIEEWRQLHPVSTDELASA
jgi:DNA replication protein DnaC